MYNFQERQAQKNAQEALLLWVKINEYTDDKLKSNQAI